MPASALRAFLDLRKSLATQRVGDGGQDVCDALTGELDGALRELGSDLGTGSAVVALGGYGRGEQCIWSDVDVMLLHAVDDPEPLVQTVLYPLWDANLKVGHAVRTVEENREAALEDVETITSLLSARLVTGDRDLFADLLALVTDLVRKRPLAQVLASAEWQRRVTDPYPTMTADIKNGRGGLRTHHGFWWERRRADLLGLRGDPPTPEEIRSRETLLSIRNALHAVSGRPQDRFLVDLREPAADWLSLDVRTLAERYTLALDAGDRLADQRWPDLHAEHDAMVRLGRRIFGSVVSRFSPSTSAKAPDRPLAIAVNAAGRPDGARLTSDEEAAIAAAEPEPWTAADRSDFIRLLTAGERGRTIFGRLEALGWVEHHLPEWQVVGTAAQLAPFHDHPVGAHLWRAVDEMETLIEGTGTAADIATAIGSTEELLLAAFLHDIGKARGGDHSAIGAELAARILRRAGYGPSTVAVVGDVVRHHLLLAETATRRDIGDLDVINEIADLVGDVRRLDILYLLTIADQRATGTTMWNDWRATLIDGLYGRVREAIEAGTALPATRDVDAVLAVADGRCTRREVEEHVAAMPPGYLESTTPDEVRAHIELSSRLEGPAVLLVGDGDDGRVTVAGADRSGFLLAVVRAFTANGVGVLDARLRTRADGIAIDSFHVASDHSGEPVPRARWAAVESDLVAALQGEKDLRPVIKERVAAYRQTSRGQAKVTAGVEGRFTVVEVRARDRIGLLADLVAAMHGDGLDVHLARIDTMGGEARDLFYVRRIGGVPIRDEAELAALAHRLENELEG